MGKSDFQSSRTEALVRSYRRADRRRLVVRLGPVISELYPGGFAWLRKRLDDVETGAATCTVVTRRDRVPLGTAIETPKERGRIKLSTLWVDRSWRGRGLGQSLLLNARERWLADDIQVVNLTAEVSVAASMAPFLSHSGFRVECIDRDRYGEGRHEVVFGWRPDADPIVAAGCSDEGCSDEGCSDEGCSDEGCSDKGIFATDLYVASK